MLNKVLLIGRLTRATECRYISNSDCVCNFGLATSEKYTDKSGNKVEKTEFHNITLYRKLAEIAAKYLQKGSLVYLEGKIQSRKYTGKDGIERTAYEIVCSEMKMLGGKAAVSYTHLVVACFFDFPSGAKTAVSAASATSTTRSTA